MEVRAEIQARYMHLGVIRLSVVFKATRWDGARQTENTDPRLGPGHFNLRMRKGRGLSKGARRGLE